MSSSNPVQPAVPRPEDLSLVASFDRYEDAQEAVDLLSDKGFPVETVQIIGHDVRSQEIVQGRMTKGRAALGGALSGAWFGLLISLLLSLFVTVGSVWGLILTALVLGAIWGAVFGFLGHAMTGGRRDFVSTQAMTAARYDVMTIAANVEEATRIVTFGRNAPPVQRRTDEPTR